jgi:WD40 repeat protein
MNITKFLQKREFSSSRPNLFKACSHQLFDMRVTHQISPFSSLLIQPSRVDSIVQVGDNCLVFILHQSGVCSVYNTQTKKRVCLMNVFPHTFIITKVDYNPYNDSVIITSTAHIIRQHHQPSRRVSATWNVANLRLVSLSSPLTYS